jgi:hypothetical protein
MNELFRTNMAAIGVRTRFDIAQWPELLKSARAGKLQIWSFGFSPEGRTGWERWPVYMGHSRAPGTSRGFAMPSSTPYANA